MAIRRTKETIEIYGSIRHEHTPRLRDILNQVAKVRKIVWVGIGLAVFQPLVGINVVFFNFPRGPVMWVLLAG